MRLRGETDEQSEDNEIGREGRTVNTGCKREVEIRSGEGLEYTASQEGNNAGVARHGKRVGDELTMSETAVLCNGLTRRNDCMI